MNKSIISGVLTIYSKNTSIANEISSYFMSKNCIDSAQLNEPEESSGISSMVAQSVDFVAKSDQPFMFEVKRFLDVLALQTYDSAVQTSNQICTDPICTDFWVLEFQYENLHVAEGYREEEIIEVTHNPLTSLSVVRPKLTYTAIKLQ